MIKKANQRKKNKQYISPKRSRLISFFSKNRQQRASLTVEASLVVPFFFFFITLFWRFFLLVLLELSVGKAVVGCCLEYGRYGYLERKGLKENAEYMGAFYQPLIAGKMPKTRLATDWRINCTEMEEGQIKVSISYRFLCEVPFFQGWRFPIRQEFCFLPYIGVYDPDQYEEQEEKKEDIVYVTKNGTVYHESKNCTYLRMNVRRVSGEKLEKERNFSGGKYEACLSCRGKEGQYFYVTDYGTKYHTSLQCSSICRDIKEISREAAANMKRCSKCGKKNEKQN